MIGPHVIGSVDVDLLRRWQPRVCLVLDPAPGVGAAIKAASPNTIIIGRVYRPDDQIQNAILNAPESAAGWADETIAPSAAANREIDYWQFNNEVCQVAPDQIARLARFSIRYMDLLAGRGLRAAIGAFSVGQPQAPELDGGAAWSAFHSAMRHAKTRGGVLLLHAYGAPKIYDSSEQWYLHRYELKVKPTLPDDIRDMPYLYGEYGSDMGVVVHGQRLGWRTGYAGNADAYINDLQRAANVIARSPGCLGACVFTLGSPNGDWRDFDIAGDCAQRMAQIQWPAPAVAGMPPPAPVPPPAPTGVEIVDILGRRQDIAWLDRVWGAELLQADTRPGEAYYKLIRLEEVEGPASLPVRVLNERGQPAANIIAARHWPDAPNQLPAETVTRWKPNAIIGRTNASGEASFGLGAGDYITARGQGVTTVWIADPAYKSDGASKLGMIAGTNHRVLRTTFQLAHVAGSVDLRTALLDEAQRRQAIQFNPAAALQKAIFAAGFVPNSPEFDVSFGGANYVAQRAERLGDGRVRVYYCAIGDWTNVRYVE